MSNGTVTTDAIAPNAMRLLWAGLARHFRGRHRRGHPRRHPCQLGRRFRVHRRAARCDRRRRVHRLLLRHHHRRRRRRQDWLRQAGRRRVPVPRAVGLHHVCRDQRTVAGHRVPVSLHRHVRVRAGQRHARGGGQPAGLDAVPQQPHALPEHPARELAGGPGGRRPDWLDPWRRLWRQLEDSARAVPGADRALRRLRSWASTSRSRRRPRRV